MPSSEATKTDVLVVGAGPIGIELAIALRQAGIDYVQLEKGQVGQTISWYPRLARFFSSADRIAIAGAPLYTPAQDKATREEYLLYLRALVAQFDLEVRTYERVTTIRRAHGFEIESICELTGVHRSYRARRVVCVIGDMHMPRLLGVPGEELPFVSHYFESPDPYFQRRLLIVGGRNSAVEAALRCHHAGARVTLSCRAPELPEESIKYWLLPEIRGLCRTGAIRFLPGTQVRAIEKGRVLLRQQERELEVDADFVLLLTGYLMDGSLLEGAGVELCGEQRVPRFDPATMETNVPGLYVAGTATAGSQRPHRIFIENSHEHVVRIVAALTGRSPPPPSPPTRRELES